MHTVRARVTVALLAAGLCLTACTVTAPAASTPSDPRPVAAFYGDSYTLGTGASDPRRRWSSLVSSQHGWQEFNPSVNGLGFVANRDVTGDGDLPDQIIRANPAIVFIAMGLNDNFVYDRDAAAVRRAIRADVTRLHDALPHARFVVVEPFWYTADRPDSVATIIRWVHDEADAIGADWIPGASHWLDGHYAGDADSWMAADGLHPDDIGYAEMAARMESALDALEPPLE